MHTANSVSETLLGLFASWLEIDCKVYQQLSAIFDYPLLLSEVASSFRILGKYIWNNNAVYS